MVGIWDQWRDQWRDQCDHGHSHRCDPTRRIEWQRLEQKPVHHTQPPRHPPPAHPTESAPATRGPRCTALSPATARSCCGKKLPICPSSPTAALRTGSPELRTPRSRHLQTRGSEQEQRASKTAASPSSQRRMALRRGNTQHIISCHIASHPVRPKTHRGKPSITCMAHSPD